MPDQNIREIQLGGKQLVFLFMASVVLAVAIFLLGISVGRGVRDTSVETPVGTDVSAAAEAGPPADMPPPTKTTPVDLSYHDKLQGQTPPSAEPAPVGKPLEVPAKPADPPKTLQSSAASAETVSRQASGAGRSKTSMTPATPPRAAEKITEKPAAAPARGGGWFVQVNAFRSKENADREVAQLKAKGYAAASVSLDASGSLFRVRLGPFPERPEAQRVAERIREGGMNPSIQR